MHSSNVLAHHYLGFPGQTGASRNSSGVTVGPNILVNNPGVDGATAGFTQNETTNLLFGNTIVAGFNDSESFNGISASNSQFTGYSISTDGGNTFTDLGALPMDPNGDAGDPALARDNTSGTIYFSTLAFGSFFGSAAIQVFRSTDGGHTFQAPVNAAPGVNAFDFPDKEWITVDNFAGAGQGNVYTTFTDFGSTTRIVLTRSTDGGATWGPNNGVTIASGTVQGSYVAVGPDHSVYVFWLDGNGPAEQIMMVKSTDQGMTFGTPVVVATLNTFGVNGDLGLEFRTNAFPHVAINPVSGNIYVAFNDTPGGGDRSNIYFTQSTDGGNTFSPAVQVNDDGGTNDQWQPFIAVKPNGSELFIGWYDRRLDPNNSLIDVFGEVGKINGNSVDLTTPNFRITDTSFPPAFGNDPYVNFSYMGDYDIASADNSAFYVTWGDNRLINSTNSFNQPDVRFAKINTGMQVISSTPADGSFVASRPTSYVVHFSDAYDPATVQASDLTVNGMAATGVTQTDATTLRFTFTTNPVTAQGPQTMAMAMDAVERLSDHSPLEPFNATFYYDSLRLQETSTSPAPGSVLNLPADLVVHFNEAIDPSTVSTTNLVLYEGTVTAAALVHGDPTSIDYKITAPPSADGTTLTVSMADGTLKDTDGNPGLGFSASYQANVLLTAYPTPLASTNPQGSLIYDPTVSASIGFVGDTDSYTVRLDPGQTATLVVTGASSLQAGVDLYGPTGNHVAGTTASASGAAAVLQAVPITMGGTYKITVSGANNTTGTFSVQLILNAAAQKERYGGPSDDTITGAQNLTNSFINLGNGASRGAVLGFVPGGVVAGDVFVSARGGSTGVYLLDNNGNILAQFTNPVFQNGLVGEVELGPDGSVYVPVDTSFGGGVGEILHFDVSGNLLATIPLPNDLPFGQPYPFGIAVASDGSFWVAQANGGNVIHTDASGNLLASYSVGGTPEDVAIRSDGQLFIANQGFGSVQQLDPTSGNVTTFVSGLGLPEGVNFTPSGNLTVADLFNGILTYDSSGNLVQTVFDPEVSDAEVDLAGNFFGAALSVDKFDPSGNLVNSTSLNGETPFGLGVVGVDGPAPPPPDTTDYYSFTLAQGQSASVALTDLSGGKADIQLQDGPGTALALGKISAGSANEVINNFVSSTGGTYYVRVTGNGAHYSLVVTKGGDFDTGSSPLLSQAQPLEGGTNALGFAGTASLLTKSGGPQVLYFVDSASSFPFTQAFTNLGITPTVASSYFDFESKLASQSWDLVVLLNQGFFDTTWVSPMVNYVQGGGRAILSSWLGNNTAAAAFGAQYTGNTDQSSINQTVATDPIWSGISNPFQLSNPGWFTFSTGMHATTGQSIGQFPNGEDALVVGNGRHTILNGFLSDTAANSTEGVTLAQNEITAMLVSQDTDTYSFAATAGNKLTIATATPGGGPGQFVNTFDPALNLYDSNGNLVASDDNSGSDGRNALIHYTVPTGASGTYYIQVLASPLTSTPTSGEYALSVKGATGPLPPFQVTATDPPAGALLQSLPSITVDFNDSIYLPSLSAASLTVDGKAAASFTINSDHEATWTLPALSGTGDHVPHTIAIGGNALSDIQGTGVSAFSETIFIDNVRPSVVRTSIKPGQILPPGSLAFQVTFSEPIDTALVTPSSFDLHGKYRRVDYGPASFSFDSTGTVLTINYANLPDDAYQMTLFAGGFADLVGLTLTNNVAVNFFLDSDTAVGLSLAAQNPLGSLIYAGSVTDVVAPRSDSDVYTLSLSGGDTVSLDLLPDSHLQPAIALMGPTGGILASTTTGAPGTEAVLNGIHIGTSGTYQIAVTSAAGGTAGLYNLQVMLNAAVDSEAHGGPSNDTTATAQNLTGSFLNLGAGSRGAVIGTLVDAVDYYSFAMIAGQSATVTLNGPGLAMELDNVAGVALAHGRPGPTNVDQSINNFVALQGGAYYIKVTGTQGINYTVVVTRGLNFDLENNNDPANAQSLNAYLHSGGTGGVLGTVFAVGGAQVGANFEGLSYNDTNCGCSPPDGALAVGDGFVMEAVNTAIRISDPQGNILLSEELATFFAPLQVGSGGDPYIVYDDLANRWYVLAVDGGLQGIEFAVSNDANPMHGFSLQNFFNFGGLIDFPKMGFNADAVVITGNDFGASGLPLQGISIDKSALLQGTLTFYTWQRDGTHFRAEVPAWMHGSKPGDPMYLVEEAGYENGTAARVVTMTNILSDNPSFTDTNIPVDPYGPPPFADQPGFLGSVTTNDTTFTRADWRNGMLVSAQNVGLPSDNFAEAHVRWYEFNTTGSTPTLVQQGTISPGPGISTYFGSVALDASGNIGMTYMESSANEYVSEYVTGRLATDPLGTMSPGRDIAPGQGLGTFFRAGDYSGIAVDPSDGHTFWAENEYQGNAFWNTRVASFQVMPPTDSDYYTVTTKVGDVLTFWTSTPGTGATGWGNALYPTIDLYGPNGKLIATNNGGAADGRNDFLRYIVPAHKGGKYMVRVYSQNGTEGEYLLYVHDATGGGPRNSRAATPSQDEAAADEAATALLGTTAPTVRAVTGSSAETTVTSARTTTTAPSGMLPGPLDAGGVNRFFAASDEADRTLSADGHIWRQPAAAETGDWDVLADGPW
jgi:sugar lactone lactonase YvrE